MSAKHVLDNLGAAERIAGLVQGLLLKSERVAATYRRGAHGKRRAGQGEAFWQFRPYQDGDARKDIDWRQTAKREGETFVRQKELETAQTLWLYRDATASMDYHSSPAVRKKKDYAEILLLALAILALDGGERVGLLGTDLPPQAHAGAIGQLQERLQEQRVLTEAARPVAMHAQAVIISDFYFDLGPFLDLGNSLLRRQVGGAVIQVFDPAEKDLAFKGRVKFLDPEDAEAAPLTIEQVEAARLDYQGKFQAHQAALAAAAKSWGWSFFPVCTDERLEDVLLRLYAALSAQEV